MLLNRGKRHTGLISELGTVHNYYEHLVFNEIGSLSERAKVDMNYMADVACVALNHLPPRYIRHDVDMSFFLSPAEMAEIETKVKSAVEKALAFVSEREQARLDVESTDNA